MMNEIKAAAAENPIHLDAAHPSDEWNKAEPVSFDADWQGQNADSTLGTTVRVLWSPETLYLRFVCHYHELRFFDDSDTNGRRDHLWDRDVVEAFIKANPSREFFYQEFEISPNGMWIDLDIFPGGLADLKSGLQRSVYVDEKLKTWFAELAIPMKALTAHFDPKAVWRVNFYRVEGKKEPRSYLAWRPTNTPEPNFHVPRAFGYLQFLPAK